MLSKFSLVRLVLAKSTKEEAENSTLPKHFRCILGARDRRKTTAQLQEEINASRSESESSQE